MRDFESGLTYLRKEARESGFIADSDNDDVLVERLAGLLRDWKPKEAVDPVAVEREEAAKAEAEPGEKEEKPEEKKRLFM